MSLAPIYLTDASGQTWLISVNATGNITSTKVVLGGSFTGGYPTLETIANLVRVFLNDWQPGATGAPGEGQITTDNPSISPQTLPAINSAIRQLYRKLRNVGDPTLIKDNVLVNLPANSVTGPSVQTYLSFGGYFDGGYLNGSPSLPPDLIYPVELWEQQTNGGTVATSGPNLTDPNGGNWAVSIDPTGNLETTPIPPTGDFFETDPNGNRWDVGIDKTGKPTTTPAVTPPAPPIALPFIRMHQPQFGLSSRNQTFALGEWEWRGDQINFVGSLAPITIRIRYLAALTQFVSPLDFTTVRVPIMDCEEYVAYTAAAIIAKALSGVTPGTTDLDTKAQESLFDLKNAITRRAQSLEYQRQQYTGDHEQHNKNIF